jgi:hypothetical protein
VEPTVPGGEPAAAGMVQSVAALGSAGACDHPALGRGNHLSALPAGWKRLIRPYVQQQAFRT